MSKKFLAFSFIELYCICYAIAADTPTALQCYSCRGINCLRTTTQNVTETCNSLDACVTIFEKFAVVAKGCLQDMPIELRSKCADEKSPECQVCVGGLCNNLGRKDFKCYECDEKDQNCYKNVTALTPVQCKTPSAPNSYCFTQLTGFEQARRGCSLHVKDQQKCLKDENCELCSVEHGQGCNHGRIREHLVSGGVRDGAAFLLVVLCASVAWMIFRF